MADDKKSKKKKIGFTVLAIVVVIALFLLIFGKKIFYKIAAHYIYSNVKKVEEQTTPAAEVANETESNISETEDASIDMTDIGSGEYDVRDEDYITNFLIIGIEDIEGASNTDTMIIATIDTKTDKIKLTSLMRDSYVEIPGYKSNKLNSVYSKGGIDLLVDTIELNYKIAIDGYATVNLEDFESVVDVLGGIDIELSSEEVEYLNTTNYISDYSNHTLRKGMNHLNGNQVVGYCRVRKVATIEGDDSDYGRTLRHRKVLHAIFDQYMSNDIFELYNITGKCLSYVTTDLSESEIEKVISEVVDNKIMTMDTSRLPVDDAYTDTKEGGPIPYSLIYDWDVNVIELYKFIYDDTYEEAVDKYNMVLKSRGEDTIEATCEDTEDDDLQDSSGSKKNNVESEESGYKKKGY